ncbi:hypothetical protein GCM10022223_32980 [Kineosporia mesophila]|uniref:Uncharacterized protein n=1 Tax=Kineosporia mesophila TaxID=566012 RepID=A0ABP6ZM91_9ACTN
MSVGVDRKVLLVDGFDIRETPDVVADEILDLEVTLSEQRRPVSRLCRLRRSTVLGRVQSIGAVDRRSRFISLAKVGPTDLGYLRSPPIGHQTLQQP